MPLRSRKKTADAIIKRLCSQSVVSGGDTLYIICLCERRVECCYISSFCCPLEVRHPTPVSSKVAVRPHVPPFSGVQAPQPHSQGFDSIRHFRLAPRRASPLHKVFSFVLFSCFSSPTRPFRQCSLTISQPNRRYAEAIVTSIDKLCDFAVRRRSKRYHKELAALRCFPARDARRRQIAWAASEGP